MKTPEEIEKEFYEEFTDSCLDFVETKEMLDFIHSIRKADLQEFREDKEHMVRILRDIITTENVYDKDKLSMIKGWLNVWKSKDIKKLDDSKEKE